jgi:hypothetical protein
VGIGMRSVVVVGEGRVCSWLRSVVDVCGKVMW